MFTGLIEAVGAVKGIAKRFDGASLVVESEALGDVAIGDSVAINGVCLTVVRKEKRGATFDVVRNTLEGTTLNNSRVGDRVNIEKALRAGDHIGGHFVSGHVDCVGKIKDMRAGKGSSSIEVGIPRGSEKFIVEKGSVAIDGISLTVAGIKDERLTVHIIPHTMSVTTLASRRVGDSVNLEFDLLIKQALKEKGSQGRQGVTEDFLREKGFI